ncbi:MAG: type II toxin-antitoxin system RelE/ParE family toxin [Pseudanabaena sp. ELA645]|jgi:mRNA-degrading endonuclease RelE of RelBE toxin-antitoxin system
MESNQSIVQVETSGNFERQFRGLFKRYRKIRSDVQPIIEQLQSGEVLGDRLSGLNIFVFKVRVKNSDIQKGKSAGYRLIYQIETPTRIILLAIYAKSDQSSISTTEIEEIVEAFKRQQEQSEI